MPDSASFEVTLKRLGHPSTWIADYEHWVVLLHPDQSTLGALALICRDQAPVFSDISPHAFDELKRVAIDLERVVGKAFDYTKINYLVLMEDEAHTLIRAVPRYDSRRTYEEVSFDDPGWPGLPDLVHRHRMDVSNRDKLVENLRAEWPREEE